MPIPLRAARIAAGLTQIDAARAMHVTPNALTRWESGLVIPRGDKLIMMAKLYGFAAEDLIIGAPNNQHMK